jgi:hypothetical protein
MLETGNEGCITLPTFFFLGTNAFIGFLLGLAGSGKGVPTTHISKWNKKKSLMV